jgi:hypothetical protein
MHTISIEQLAKHQFMLQPNINNYISPTLANCYKVKCAITNNITNFDISQCLLSPRATYLSYDDARKQDGFSICNICKQSITAGYMPKFCIANNFCFGSTPDCLLRLTEIELAMITPVKTYGYCFSYTGGVQRQLKGSLSYYKVKTESILRSVAHFDALNLINNVIVLLYGKMTPSQYQNAKKKSRIRTGYVLDAIRWLLQHNVKWQKYNLTYDDVVNSLTDPILVNNTSIVGSVNDNNNTDPSIESTESFQVFFPDGRISNMTGGQENINDFQEIAKEAAINGYDIEFRLHLFKEAVSDYKDDNLVNACLLQFPYGRGGMDEEHVKPDGTITSNIDISEYIKYLSMQSQPQFHKELFTLILYNMQMKQMMVKTAGWKVRNKADAKFLANELNMEDINEAIDSAKYARGISTNGMMRGRKLLGSIDTISKTVPHTNEAARRARRDAETLQHHFGCPSFFLTVTPDDDNSYLIQVYSQMIIDNDEDIAGLSDQELFERSKKERSFALHFLEFVHITLNSLWIL